MRFFNYPYGFFERRVSCHIYGVHIFGIKNYFHVYGNSKKC